MENFRTIYRKSDILPLVEHEEFINNPPDSFFKTYRVFCEQVRKKAQQEVKQHLWKTARFFDTNNPLKQLQILEEDFGPHYSKYEWQDDEMYAAGVPEPFLNYIEGLLARAIHTTFMSLPKYPSMLPFTDDEETASKSTQSDDQMSDLEIVQPQQHQSKPKNSNEKRKNVDHDSSSKSRDRTSKKKSKDLEKKNVTSSNGESTSTSNPQSNKKTSSRCRQGPRITKVLTGHVATDSNRVKILTVYDIPATWTEQHIMLQLKSWGSLIQLSTKVQRKYQTLRVIIELADNPLQAFNRGDWVVSLGGIPVRWFPGTFTLKERKQREKFYAVINNIPETMTTENLFSYQANQFLTNAGVKAFKIIKDSSGSAKLLCYFKKFDTMHSLIGTETTWVGSQLLWASVDKMNKKKTNLKKSSKIDNNTSNRYQSKKQTGKMKNSGSKKGKKSSKNTEKSKKPFKKKHLKKLLADILDSFLK
jgi:hypothetical protein